MTAPSVFSIPPGESFVDALARVLMAENAADPLALSAMLILLPTRRACRALRDAFLRHGGGRPLLLPSLRPLGDVDEDEVGLGSPVDLPPAAPPLRRQLLLAQLIIAMGPGRGGQTPTPEQAVRLAAELGNLLDQVHTEGLSFEALAALVPADFAAHWQITLDFLAILTRAWPAILAEQGWMEGALRRSRLLEDQAVDWETNPPPFPVIAAGSTGSIPATARLLSVVARLPQGRLVLPGLDQRMDAESLAALDQSHPQYGLIATAGAFGPDSGRSEALARHHNQSQGLAGRRSHAPGRHHGRLAGTPSTPGDGGQPSAGWSHPPRLPRTSRGSRGHRLDAAPDPRAGRTDRRAGHPRPRPRPPRFGRTRSFRYRNR